MTKKLICFFQEIGIKDVSLVGGKNASLGEMIRELGSKINIPDGFATTSFFYWRFVKETGLFDQIKNILKDLDTHQIKNLQARGKKIRELILKTPLPKDLEKEIIKAYHRLSQKYQINLLAGGLDVAVRSSATAEDLPGASFAGQQESFLNIRGEKALLKAVKECIASLFNDRAISYRQDMGFDHLKVALSVGVQKMVRSDLAGAGVMFSCDTESGFPDVVLITAAYGLGESVVKGSVNTDQYFVFETTLKKGFKPILEKKLGEKASKLIYSQKGGIKKLLVAKEDQNKFVLTDQEILTLARWSCLIEDHYQKPMDIEWAKDGRDNQLYIVQARPETVTSKRNLNFIEIYKINKPEKIKILAQGLSVGDKIGQGSVRVIHGVKEIHQFKKGEVLVTTATNPDWEPIMKIASAIITEKGSRTCHAAIVSREMGIPCIVGVNQATKILKNNQKITISCAEGENGFIYQGLIPFEIKRINLKKIVKPKTKIMLNLGEPDQAFALSFLPVEGIGLAREEFIINNYIKIHPLALLNYKKLSGQLKKQIDLLTAGWSDKKQFFIDNLAYGIGKLAAAFYPKDVIVRFSDFKTNEYANLIGGQLYEPKESNPMLGWRGASRYYDPKHKDAFALECLAIKKIREEFGLDNVKVMVPFCRTVEEGQKVLAIIDSFGLRSRQPSVVSRQLKSLAVYVMAEIPSNVILAKEFAKIFDGFSIGSNDLTQLTLGLDRDSELIAHIFDERNEAIKILIKQLIKTARQYKRKVGICGDAPSSFPDFAKFLVEAGIDSISLTSDAVIKTTLEILKAEKRK